MYGAIMSKTKFKNKRRHEDVDRMKPCHVFRFLGFVLLGWGNPITYLFVLLFALVGLAYLVNICSGGAASTGVKWVSQSLFDINTAIRAESPWVSLASCLLFAFTWFLGSGVMFSAIASRCIEYRYRRRHGIIHHKFCKERGHILILGWDYNVLSLLREMSHRRAFLGKGREKQYVAIVTMENAEILRPIVRNCGKSEFLRVAVCRGRYDDIVDLKSKFAISNASEIYILGEPHEQDHDGQMLNLLSKLNFALGASGLSGHIPAHVKINSYLLYSKLRRSKKDNDRYRLVADYFNFYDIWSKKLWATLPGDDTRTYPALRYLPMHEHKIARVVIVGFSQMGQALTVQATRLSNYGDDVRTELVVIDVDVVSKMDGFLREFPNIKDKGKEIVNHDFEFKNICSFRGGKFLAELSKLVDDNAQTSILLTMSDSGLALELMKDILDLLKERKHSFNLFVRQDILTFDTYNPSERLLDLPECETVHFFGFRNEISCNLWMRDLIADMLFESRKRSDNSSNTYNTSYRKERFRYRVDAFSEMLNSCGFEIVQNTDEREEAKIDDGSRMTLGKAEHRRWLTGEIINVRSDPVASSLPTPAEDPRFKDEANETDMKHIDEIKGCLDVIKCKIVKK